MDNFEFKRLGDRTQEFNVQTVAAALTQLLDLMPIAEDRWQVLSATVRKQKDGGYLISELMLKNEATPNDTDGVK